MKDYKVHFYDGFVYRDIFFYVSNTWLDPNPFRGSVPILLQYSDGYLVAIFKYKYRA